MTFSAETIDGSGESVNVRGEVGASGQWRTYRGETTGGAPVAVRTLRGTVPESAYDRFDVLCSQWETIAGRQSVRAIVGWGVEPEPWVAVEYADDELERLVNGETVAPALACDVATKVALGSDVCETIRTYARYGSTSTHLAVQPESVAFGRDEDNPVAIIGDWGVSRLVEEPPVTSYTAPEQIDGTEVESDPDKRTDVHRIGALMYHLLAGDEPFAEVDDRNFVAAIADGIADTPSGLEPLPDRFRQPIGQAMAPDPEERQQSVYELQSALAASTPRVPAGERRIDSLLPIDAQPTTGSADDDDADATEGDSAEKTAETNPADATESDRDDGPDEGDAGSGAGGDEGDEPAPTAVDDDSEATSSGSGILLRRAILGYGAVGISFVGGVYGAEMLGIGPFAGGDDTISGTVLDGEDGDGVQGATVVLLNGTSEVERDETDGEGNFAFNGLDDGDYTLQVDAESHQYEQKEVVTLGESVELVPIEPDAESVVGIVVDAADGSTIYDASVELLDADGDVIADADGGEFAFEIDDPDAEYTVRANANGYVEGIEEAIVGDLITVELAEGLTTLSGTVRDTTEGKAIDEATVTAENDASETESVDTDAGGTYELELTRGEYDLTADADGYVSEDETVTVDAAREEQNFELDEEASWSVVVRDADEGRALNGTEITLYVNGEEVDGGLSDVDGRLEFEGLKPTELRAEVERSGFEDKGFMIELEPGEELERDIEMELA